MELLKSLKDKTKLYEVPFKHFELNNPLTDEAIKEICEADITDPKIEKLNYDDQKNEYEKCLSSISNILKKPKNETKYMSHPCGSYNKDTLEILKELGVDLGFKQIMTIEKEKGMKKINNSSLEVARIDHAEIFKIMN